MKKTSDNEKKFIKSPLNYTGGKYKLLKQIIPLFPTEINTFIDLFCGGCNVGLNVPSNRTILNDSMAQLQEIYAYWAENGYDNIKKDVLEHIDKYQLSKTNEEGYYKLREDYNNNPNPADLFVLIAYSFNNQIRFNSKGQYNMPFGKNRSDFNQRMDKNLKEFIEELSNGKYFITCSDFNSIKVDKLEEGDFIYADPPYLITTASYNENGGWGENEEKKLFDLLDRCTENNIKFALSNVLENKGKENNLLKEWAKKYNVHHLNTTYGNCSYHAHDKSKNTTDEVLITNY